MRGRLFGAAVAAVALLALLQPANAVSAPQLRISGRGTAYADLVLPSGVRLDQDNARLVVRRGTYAAWWLTRIGEEPTARGNQLGGVRWVDADDPSRTHPSAIFGFRSEPLAAGRYRVYLATDGEATIEIPAAGLGASRDVRPTRRTKSAATTRPMTVLPGGVVADDDRTSFTLPATALAVSSVRTAAEPGATVEVLSACLTKPGGNCDGPTTTQGYTTSVVEKHAVRFNVSYLPGEAPAGLADSVHRAQAGPRVTHASASVFYLVTTP